MIHSPCDSQESRSGGTARRARGFLLPAVRILFAAMILAVAAPAVGAQTFPVLLKKSFWPDGAGEIHITEDGIEYRAAKEKHNRRWHYRDMQLFDRVSGTEFVILTYEDQKWKLGRDREFRFLITSGELSDESFRRIEQRLTRPATNRVVGDVPNPVYEVPVKHLHATGGCEGRLLFTDRGAYYATPHEKHAREWNFGEQVQSVWSSGPYQIELHVQEKSPGGFSRTTIFRFDLKERLDEDFYRELKLRLYRLETASR